MEAVLQSHCRPGGSFLPEEIRQFLNPPIGQRHFVIW